VSEKKSYGVLIADDNHHVRDILANGLVRKGREAGVELEMMQASDGDEAWKFIESGKVDLAILDFYMPNVDGGTVLDRVRSSAEHATMPVLVVSSEEDRKNVALAGGADRFLDKPLRLVDLAEEVRTLLRIDG
jgi:two-component system chemotaxis response regulator CheY